MKTKVLLVGGRSKAKSLALSLLSKSYQVSIINKNYEDCLKLAEIENLNVIHGDGTKPYVLEDANIREMDIVIALTSYDEDNLVICELCKTQFNVKKTLTLISDPKKTEFFSSMGIDSVVCATSAITNIIEQEAFMKKMATLVPLGEGLLKIAEVPINKTASVVGKKLWELNLPKEVIVACIIRSDVAVVPSGDTYILAGDKLVLISSEKQEMEAIKILTGW